MLSVLASPRGTSRRRGFGRRVRFATADVRLTGHDGLVTVTELDRVLGIRQAMDESVGPIKERARGVSAVGLLLSMACAQLPVRISWSAWTGAARTRPGSRWSRFSRRRRHHPDSWR